MKPSLIDHFIAWLTLFSGLSISIVAIYYSVAGLVVIFAAAAIPIIVMGVTLEVGKLVAALWLKWNWQQAPFLIKFYLTIAVIVLMFITSMGIFGFLSKAHIDQKSSGLDSVARVTQIEREITRQTDIIERAEQRLQRIETSGVGADANVQSQIDAEQARIDSAYQRIQPAIDEQQRIIDSQIKLLQDELAKLDQELATLQGYIDTDEIRRAQAMVGTRVDGVYGPATAAAFQRWQAAKAQERNEIIARIESANTNPTVREARDEIQRLRQGAERQVEQSNELINRLRSQLGQTDASEVERLLTEQRTLITAANQEIDNLTSQKYQFETETRRLEAEVGPIKFIADFIYGDEPGRNTLEEAVRWMIVVIVAVFDPLAIIMLLASQHSFIWLRRARTEPEIKKVIEPIQETKSEVVDKPIDHPMPITNFPYLKSFKSFVNSKPVAEVVNDPIEEIDDDQEELENAHPSEKQAMQKWKAEDPRNCLKHQRKLLNDGVIETLPWGKYLEENDDNEAAAEAAKWAQEQIEESKKKDLISWMEREGNQQIKKSKEQ
jgi:peptidoglycan hydrolase-like protein with peptidoglycan-binding domain